MEELKGLSSEEVKCLVREYGYNEIAEEKESYLLDFLKRFTGLTAYVIEVSIVISILIARCRRLCSICSLSLAF